MMIDDFDDHLRDAARSYNLPPEPPREAMWEAIARARSAVAVTPIVPARRVPRWLAAAAGIAAVLVAGIALGRTSMKPVSQQAIATPVAAAEPLDARLAPASPADSAGDSGPVAGAVRTTPGTARAAQTKRGLADAQRAMAALAQRAARRERANVAGDMASEANAQRLAVVEHLTRTEVLLTSFRAQARSTDVGVMDAQFGAFTRDLLSTTRLLLATRRSDDPIITRLLEDVELVLMQLSQYARDGRRVDLDATNQSLDKRNVLPKLRSSIPPGVSASAGT